MICLSILISMEQTLRFRTRRAGNPHHHSMMAKNDLLCGLYASQNTTLVTTTRASRITVRKCATWSRRSFCVYTYISTLWIREASFVFGEEPSWWGVQLTATAKKPLLLSSSLPMSLRNVQSYLREFYVNKRPWEEVWINQWLSRASIIVTGPK